MSRACSLPEDYTFKSFPSKVTMDGIDSETMAYMKFIEPVGDLKLKKDDFEVAFDTDGTIKRVNSVTL